jgi:hypothetical protein
VLCGDARHLPALPPATAVVRSAGIAGADDPPYGPSVHGQVHAAGAGRPVRKSHDRYSNDPTNLAHQTHVRLVEGFTDILTRCREYLAPNGVVAITARPYRRAGLLVDIPGDVIRAGETAGLVLHERIVCLLADVNNGQLIPRSSFFHLHTVRQARNAGRPLAVIAHEDLLIFRTH